MTGSHVHTTSGQIGIKLAWRCILIALLLSLLGCGEDRVSELLSSAEHAEIRGDLTQAIADYRSATQLDPGNSFAHWRLSQALLRARDGSLAEKEIMISRRLNAGQNRTRPAMAEALYQQGRYAELVALATDGLDQSYESTLLAFQARAFTATGDLARAEAVLQRAQSLSPYMPEVAFAAAELALARGDIPAAVASARRVDMIEPNYPYSAALYGAIAEHRGDLPTAENYYNTAVSGPFDYWRDRLQRGRFYLHAGNPAAAAADAEKLLASMPGNLQVTLFAQRAFSANGDTDRALALLERWMTQAPNDLQIGDELARLAMRSGQLARSEHWADRILANDSTHPSANLLKAVIALLRNTPDTAVDRLRTLVAQYPENAGIRRLLVVSLLDQDVLAAADEHMEVLLQQLPADQTEALANAWASLSLHDSPDNRAALAAALDVDPLLRQPPQLARADAAVVTKPTDAVDVPSQAKDNHRLFGAARQHAEEGDVEAAAAALRQILASKANGYEALEALVSLSLEHDRNPDVADDIRRALEQAPQDTRLLALQLGYAEAAEDWTGAEDALLRILAIEPGRDDVRARIAMLRLEHDAAPHTALQVLEGYERSADPNLLLALAETHYRLGNLASAQTIYQNLRALAPALLTPYLRLATLFESAGNTGSERAVLQHLVEQAPSDPYTKLAITRLLAMQGKHAAARQELQGSSITVDDPERLRAALAIAFSERAYDEAVRLTRMLYTQEPGPVALLSHTRALSRNGEWERVIELLEQRVAEAPQDAFALADLAAAFAATGQQDRKLDALSTLVDLRPDDAMTLNNLAWALHRTEPARAVRLARRALELSPDVVEIADTLAASLAQQQAYPDAIDIASRVIDNSDPPSPLLMLRRAEISLLAGNADNALDDLRAINPVDIPLPIRERRMLLLHALQP